MIRCGSVPARRPQDRRRADVSLLAVRALVAAACLCASAPAAVAQRGALSGEQLIVLNKSDATASLIDLGTGAVVATMPVGTGPHEVAVSPDGRTAVCATTAPAPRRARR